MYVDYLYRYNIICFTFFCFFYNSQLSPTFNHRIAHAYFGIHFRDARRCLPTGDNSLSTQRTNAAVLFPAHRFPVTAASTRNTHKLQRLHKHGRVFARWWGRPSYPRPDCFFQMGIACVRPLWVVRLLDVHQCWPNILVRIGTNESFVRQASLRALVARLNTIQSGDRFFTQH